MALFQFKLPDVGEGMHEGEIAKWLIKEGDLVEEDQVILEVQNDKATVELPSPVQGKVKSIRVSEGTVSRVGDVLAELEVAGEAGEIGGIGENVQREPAEPSSNQAMASTSAENRPGVHPENRPEMGSRLPSGNPPSGTERKLSPGIRPEKEQNTLSENTPRTQQAIQPEDRSGRTAPGSNGEPERTGAADAADAVLATPSVRKLAREMGIDIRQVTGSGRHQQVTRDDLLTFASGQGNTIEEPPAQAVKPIEADEASAEPLAANPSAASLASLADTAGEERIPLKGIRKAIAAAMVQSVYTAPHVTVMDEVDVGKLVDFREQFKPLAEQKGIKLTYMAFFVKALVAAAREYPILNTSLDDERNEVVFKKNYHVGIATDTEKGLLVPVIRDADRKNVWTIAAEIRDLAERGREGKLSADEMQGGTITITNIGAAGGMFFTPVIRYPEAAILGTGRITEKPVVRNGDIAVGHMLALSLSFDHRIIDGATAQYAVNYIKQLLENPQLMVMEV